MSAQPSLFTSFADIRAFLLGGYQNLPLAVAGTLLLVGLMTANYAMLFLLFGFLIVTPVLSVTFTIIVDALISFFPEGIQSIFTAHTTDMCDLIMAFPASHAQANVTSFTTLWLSMMVFLMSYLLFNAFALLNRPAEYPPMADADDKSKIDSKSSTRKAQAFMSIFTIIIISIILIVMRLRSGCETIIGVASTVAIFGGLGHLWYKALSSVGEDRLSDIFGIANRLLSPLAFQDAPIACLPSQ